MAVSSEQRLADRIAGASPGEKIWATREEFEDLVRVRREELRPCPHCGREADMRAHSVGHESWVFRPTCTWCHATAIDREHWNRRVGS